jgi:hypothetical protein
VVSDQVSPDQAPPRFWWSPTRHLIRGGPSAPHPGGGAVELHDLTPVTTALGLDAGATVGEVVAAIQRLQGGVLRPVSRRDRDRRGEMTWMR